MAILTISREFGSGGREIGHAVAERMHYTYVSKTSLLSDIRSAGRKWDEWSGALDEHCPTIWEKHDWSFRGFVALLQSHMLKHALQNNVVIMGRGGNFLLDGIPHALRIRVRAPKEQRLDLIMQRESVDLETARWLAEKTDKERDCFIYAIYHKHWDLASAYDMVFDMTGQTIDEAVISIQKALIERDALNTPSAHEVLAKRSMAADVKAGILTDPSLFVPTLDVAFEGEGLVLRGVVHTPEEHKKVEEKAKSLCANVPVTCKLRYRS